MSNAPDFIGLGVEKAGTSWIFACLYEHPEICIPRKEVIFFSAQSLWNNGPEWYESYFKSRCPDQKVKGEFSTSYFYHPHCAKRIHSLYPQTKLIVCLRNPIDRALSGYGNAIKAGSITNSTTFEKAIETDIQYIDQGKYKIQFERYLTYFERSQLLILVYEDIVASPLKFIQEIYRFLEVEDQFIPPSLNRRINTSRVPGNIQVEKWSNNIAAYLQQTKLGEKLWWRIKNSKIPEVIRNLNTLKQNTPKISSETYNRLKNIYKDDVAYVESLLNRKLNWLGEKDF